MEQFITKDGKQLRLGYTTGSCAAAAAKAAAFMLLTGSRKERIRIHTPKGIDLDLAVCNIEMQDGQVSCSIEKDSGDDPDITKGTHIFAAVSYNTETDGITIDGGKGIGRVTKPGLDQPVGAAAINSVPRRMIRENVEEICRLLDYQGGLRVVISAPDGENLALKTFNPRLGITGGISILGTTGIVEPMSEDSLIETIRVEMRQKREEGAEYVLLTPGNYGTEYLKHGMGIPAQMAVMTSNYIGNSLDIARELGFQGALLVGHIGKLVKLAGGMFNTHSKYGDCRMDILISCGTCEGLSRQAAQKMLDCATCDDALRILQEEGICRETLNRLQQRIAFMMDQKVLGELKTGAILFSREYGFLCETQTAPWLLAQINPDGQSDHR